jgi:NAD(P)-dependent dehydrogenase (short-subunit alcohol dehydrogenase family)
VLLGSRDPERGAAAAASLSGDVVPIALDVTDDDSVAAAAKEVEARYGRLDVLVNNAGITGGMVAVEDTGPVEMRAALETNVVGPVRVTREFLPLLRRSAAPRIVMVSSGLGSLAVTTDPERFESKLVALHYPASKSALNMVTTQYAQGAAGVPGERRGPRLHRHRPQRQPGFPNRRGGHRRDRRAGHPARRRPHRRLLRPHRPRPLVSAQAPARNSW